MVIGDAVFGLIKGLISPVTGLVQGWQARKKVKLESDLAIATAKTSSIIRRLDTQQEGDIAWENKSIDGSGWKDEYFTIILSIPAVMCFIPGMVEYVVAGFAALRGCPGWYQWMLSIAVGSAFGYKKICDFMAVKKGA